MLCMRHFAFFCILLRKCTNGRNIFNSTFFLSKVICVCSLRFYDKNLPTYRMEEEKNFASINLLIP